MQQKKKSGAPLLPEDPNAWLTHVNSLKAAAKAKAKDFAIRYCKVDADLAMQELQQFTVEKNFQLCEQIMFRDLIKKEITDYVRENQCSESVTGMSLKQWLIANGVQFSALGDNEFIYSIGTQSERYVSDCFKTIGDTLAAVASRHFPVIQDNKLIFKSAL